MRDGKPVLVNAECTQARDIENGDLVELYYSRGSIIVGAFLLEDFMSGMVIIYEGGWPQLDSTGRCNTGLVNFPIRGRRSCRLSQATTADICLVKLP